MKRIYFSWLNFKEYLITILDNKIGLKDVTDSFVYEFAAKNALTIYQKKEKVYVGVVIGCLLGYASWLLKPSSPFTPVKFGLHLPIGLPNPHNFCYLNALLQAMSSNINLVSAIKKSAFQVPNPLLCRLVCLLEGLRCSRKYLESNHLLPIIQQAQVDLVNELVHVYKWSKFDQQDVHELFSFFCECAFSRPYGETLLHSKRGLLAASKIDSITMHDRAVRRCVLRPTTGSVDKIVPGAPVDMNSYQHHVVASRVICSRCKHHSSPVLQPEYCLTVFLEQNPGPAEPRRSEIKSSLNRKESRPAKFKLDYSLQKLFATPEPLNDILCPRCSVSSNTGASGDEKPKLLINSNGNMNGLINGTTAMPNSEAGSLKWLQRSKGNLEQSTCFKEYKIAHLPPCLVVHVQRTNWNQVSMPSSVNAFGTNMEPDFVSRPLAFAGHGTKRNEYMKFPRRLDMFKYTLASDAIGCLPNSVPNTISENHPLGDINSNVTNRQKKRPYVLRSVVVHEGNLLQAGHYTSYRLWHPPLVKRPPPIKSTILESRLTEDFSLEGGNSVAQQSNVKWIRTSDSSINEVRSDEVFNSQAYLLFYEQDPASVPGSLVRRRRYRALSPTQSDVSTLLRSKDETFSKLSWTISEEELDMEDLDRCIIEEEDFEDYALHSGIYEDVTKADLIRDMAHVS